MNEFLRTEDINQIIDSTKSESNNFKNKKIAISGAFGFIGKYILESLLLLNKDSFNIEIFAIDNFITSNKEIQNNYKDKGINCINHDINKSLNLDTEFDYIICLAGIASPYYYNKYPY